MDLKKLPVRFEDQVLICKPLFKTRKQRVSILSELKNKYF